MLKMEKKEVIKTYCKVYRKFHDYYTNALIMGIPLTIFLMVFYSSTWLHDVIVGVFTFDYGVAAFVIGVTTLFNLLIIMYYLTTFTNKYIDMLMDTEVMAVLDIMLVAIACVCYFVELVCGELNMPLGDILMIGVNICIGAISWCLESLVFANGVVCFLAIVCSLAIVGYVVSYMLFKKYCNPN